MAFGFDVNSVIWPELATRGIAVPVRVGVDRRTGKMLVGWDHVQQSVERLFVTRFHERVLRRWVGSFVPHILGESAVERTIVRFFGAIATAIDLWEPCYSVQRVRLYDGDGTDDAPKIAAERLRAGHVAFRIEGIYMPRGHLGDKTPESRRTMAIASTPDGWERLKL